jgi:hypothetical protein
METETAPASAQGPPLAETAREETRQTPAAPLDPPQEPPPWTQEEIDQLNDDPPPAPCRVVSRRTDYDREGDLVGPGRVWEVEVHRFAVDMERAWMTWPGIGAPPFAPALVQRDALRGVPGTPVPGATSAILVTSSDGSMTYHFNAEGLQVQVDLDPVADSSDYAFLYDWSCSEARREQEVTAIAEGLHEGVSVPPPTAPPLMPPVPDAALLMALLRQSEVAVGGDPSVQASAHAAHHATFFAGEVEASCEALSRGGQLCRLRAGTDWLYALVLAPASESDWTVLSVDVLPAQQP